MKLIELDKAIESIAKLEQEDNEAYGVSIPECFDSNRAIKALNNIPTIQAVPIEVLQEIRQEIESVCSLFVIDKIDRPSTDKEITTCVRLSMILSYIDDYIKEIEEGK